MFTRLAEWIYRKDWEGPLCGINWIMIGIFILVTAVAIISKNEGDIEYIHSFVWMLLLFPLTALLLIFVRIGDSFIEWCSDFVTHGDVVLKSFIFNILINDDNSRGFNTDPVLFATLFVVIPLPVFLVYTVYLLPVLLIPVGLVVGVFGMLYLARMAWGVKKRLNTHVTDPNAHSKKDNE